MKTKLPYKAYTIPILLITMVGIFTSLYLTSSHYRNYTDISYSSFCAISKAINCDTVSQSPWSIFLGMPLALWGTLAYLLFLLITIPALKNDPQRRSLWDLLFVMALLYSLGDIYFGYISAVKIEAYCIMCLLSYGVSFSLLFCTWIIRRRFNKHPLFTGIKNSLVTLGDHRPTLFLIGVTMLLFMIIRVNLPTYWVYEYPQLTKEIATGTTSEGNPWIGARTPSLTIEEFTDYQCFQCSKIHLILRQLVSQYPNILRLVHRQYPMDDKFNTVLVKKPFHVGSGQLALLAIATEKQGKFWQANDALYSIARQGITEFNIAKFAKKLHVDSELLKRDMYSKETVTILEEDIRRGLKNQIIGTPSFIIDGKMYAGQIPAEILLRLTTTNDKQ
jgi:uncharacterized membrane protein/protein-disulfide isomerase